MLRTAHYPASLAGYLSSPEARTSVLSTSISTVCLYKEGRGEGQAKGLGGLEVDYQLEAHGLFYGQVGGLGALQNSVYIVSATLEGVGKLWPVSHQAPIVGKHPEFVHGGQPVLCSKIQDLAAMRESQDFCDHEERVRALLGHGGERRLEIIGTTHFEGLQGHAQHLGRSLDFFESQDHAGISSVPEYGHAGKRWDGLFEQLQAF